MIVPPNLNEAQVLEAIEKAVGVLAPSFAFGIYDVEDIKQEGRHEALKALARYDGVRPLENFLYSHDKNRLINLKRNKYRRHDPPCPVCHRATGNRTEHEGGQFCPRYLAWKARNDAKASLMRPLELGAAGCEPGTAARAGSTVVDEAGLNEVLARIDGLLDLALRPDYLRLRAGVRLPKARRLEVEAAVKAILAEEGGAGDQED